MSDIIIGYSIQWNSASIWKW